jgi:hypothetical protein
MHLALAEGALVYVALYELDATNSVVHVVLE